MAQATRNLSISKSAYVKSSSPNTHYGTNASTAYLISGDHSDNDKNYLLFGISAWPSSLKRNKLYCIRIRAYMQVGYGSPHAYCIGDFNAGTVTYATMPAIGDSLTDFYIYPDNTGEWVEFFRPSDVNTASNDRAERAKKLLNGGAFAVTRNQGVYGSLLGWYMKTVLADGSTPYVEVTYDDAVTIKSKPLITTHPAGGDPRTARTVAWNLVKDGGDYCADETWTQASAKFYWRTQSGGSWTSINVSGNTRSLSIPANTFPPGQTIEYYVQTTDTDGTTAQTDTYTITIDHSAVVPASYPSGTVNQTAAQKFTWTLNGASQTTVAYTQASAIFYWKTSTAGSWNSVNISGSTKSVTIPANTFPSGSTIEWFLRATDTLGYTSSSPVRSFDTMTTTMTLTSYPSGTNNDPWSAIQFAWTLQNSGGAVPQHSATLYWRIKDTGSYTAIQNTGSTKSISAPANTFPAAATIQWYVSVTDAGGTVLTSAVSTFGTLATTLTLLSYPSGSNVNPWAANQFSWALQNASRTIPQQSATLYWRIKDTGSYTAIQNTGSTKSISAPAKTFPAATAIQWYVSVTDTSGLVLTSSVLTFTTQVTTLTPVSYPSGSDIDTRSAILFSWELKNSSGAVPQRSATLYWRVQNTGNYTAIPYTGSTKSISVPANTFPTGKTIQWYISVTDTSGLVLTSTARTFTTVSTKITADSYPSGNNVYTAAAIRFTWHLASAVGNYAQASAKLYWRPSSQEAYRTINVSGNTQSLNVPANTFPTGTQIQWYLQGTDIGGLTSQTNPTTFQTAATQITPQNSPTSGYADPRNAIKFQWYFASSGGAVPQGSATFYWRISGTEQWTSVAASGSTASVTIPANTFPVASVIEWYISGTDIGGTSSTSSVYSFSTAAETAYAYPKSPIGVTVDTGKPVTLRWILANADGTQPSRVELSYKTPADVTWTVIHAANTAFSEWTTAADYFPVGEVEWRVIATNRDGIAGPAGTAAFISLRAPDPPVGLSATAVPRTTIQWQGSDQEAYEIIIDGETVQQAYGKEVNSWQPDFVLEDGIHVIAVRIQGPYGLWSNPATTTIDVQNAVPAGWEDLTISGSFGVDARLSISGAESAQNPTVQWFRDGKRIAVTHGTRAYEDRYVLGAHDYYAEIWASNGNYARSNILKGQLKSCVTRIALFEDGDWIELRLSENSGTEQLFRYSRTTELRHVLGTKLPELELSEFEDISGSYDCAFTDVESAARFEALRGKVVILKSRGGSVQIGALSSLDKKYTDFYISYSFSVQAINWEDFRNV